MTEPQVQRPRGAHPLARFAPLGFGLLFGGGAFGIGAPWFVGLGVLLAIVLGALFIHVMRSRDVEHLRVSVDRSELRRGERLHVRVDVVDAERAGERLEVGLVCGVRYVVRSSRSSSDHGPDRTTVRDTAYDGWVAASPGLTVPLEVPRNQPYSHDGKILDFSWKVVVRDVAARRVDSVVETPIRVLP